MSPAGGMSAGATATGGSGGASMGGSYGGIESPGIDPSTCAGPAPPKTFALSSSATSVVPGPYVVLSGTLPDDINGSKVTSVEVGGSTRGVRVDTARGVWSYFLATPSGALPITLHAESGAMATALSAQVSVGAAALPARDLVPDQHTVGAWMFTWFTGDTSWQCSSAWRPVGGFKTWDGSVAWARDQLLDQVDAHLDAVGLQLDTASGAGAQGYRFNNIANVVKAARQLLEEGVLPPRLFPFLDTAIISDHYQTSQGAMLDLSGEAGRAYLYGHAQAFYQAAKSALGDQYGAAGTARWQGGLPAVAFWHSESMSGVDNAAVLDFKARFQADFGAACYFIAHPNNWKNFAAVDEITQMVGPPTHYLITGHDAGNFPTINVEAGFWNPTSNTFYLPREGGTHFDDAWQSAQAQRAKARHVWIDTWNETGEGSGMFAGEALTYAATDKGPCSQFVNLHAESWGSEPRHYIDVTRAQASAWNDAAELDAEPLASDAPTTFHPGEQRYVTVVMRNTGDSSWPTPGPQLGLSAAAAADDFHIAAPVNATGDLLTQRFGGVARGLPGVFTVLVTAPCTPGAHMLQLQMLDAKQGAFGKDFSIDVMVQP
jgi:hypothetical protein